MIRIVVLMMFGACGGNQAGPTGVVQNSSTLNASHEGHGGHHGETLARPFRLAFMSGHVQAGLALYRAGEPGMAAPHLQHPVSETHAAEREGLDALGFQPEVFVSVSKALEEGKPASEIEPQLRAAEENLLMMAEKAGGDPEEIIGYLLDVVVEEYSVGVKDGKIVEAGEFQDAFGFVVVALQRTESLPADKVKPVQAKLQALLSLWKSGPLPVDDPATAEEVKASVAAARQTLLTN